MQRRRVAGLQARCPEWQLFATAADANATQEAACRSGQMMKPFEDGTAKLNVGEMSGPVHTDSGVHLILRTG